MRTKICILFDLISLLFYFNSTAQITQEPTFEQFQEVNSNGAKYYNSKLIQLEENEQKQTPSYAMGTNANELMEQTYRQAEEMMGSYMNRPYLSETQNAIARNKFIVEHDPSYQASAKRTNFQNSELQGEKQMLDYLNDIKSTNNQVQKSGIYNTSQYKTDLSNYQNTFDKLKDMLEGKTPLSIADAIYVEEAAFGGVHMSYKEYKEEIARCAAFIKQYMLENGLNPNNPESVHLAIQKFMGDVLTIKNNKPDHFNHIQIPNSHKPYSYDYIDYKAEEDLHNYFLTKTLATGTGQCNTLPRVYLVLAEALGVNANLTFIHQHSFIKYKNSTGTTENYEPTIDWHMSDNDYTEDLPVSTLAIKNKMYLHPLTKKQIVANMIIDLAYNFHREHWVDDGKFMNECVDYGMQYFDNGEGHREGMLLKNLVLASQLDRILLKYNISDLNDVDKTPEAAQAYAAFRNSSDKIKKLGIQDYPDDVYNAMLLKHDSRGKLQKANGVDTKSKKSLFFNLNTIK